MMHRLCWISRIQVQGLKSSINRWFDFFWCRRRKIFNPRLTSRKITCHLLWFRSRIFHRIDYYKYYFTIFLIEFDSIWFNNQIIRQLGVTTPFNISNHWLYTSVTESNCISVFYLAKQSIRLIFECLFLKSWLIELKNHSKPTPFNFWKVKQIKFKIISSEMNPTFKS